MAEYFFTILILFLSILGLTYLIGAVSQWIFSYKKQSDFYILVPILEHIEDAEYLIRGALQKNALIGNKNTRVIALNISADDETSQICSHLEKNNSDLIFCTYDELEKNLKNYEKRT